jgi:hypothetical protein
MPMELLPGQKKIYFTVLDINPFLMEEWGWKKKDIKYWLKERLGEHYTIDIDRLNRKFQPITGTWCGNIQDFYLKSIIKNTIPEYIACPSFFDETKSNIEKWKRKPILRPFETGMIFLLEPKPPFYRPDVCVDGLAGAGGRL